MAITYSNYILHNNSMVVIGRWSIKVHLQNLTLMSETDCPKCGLVTDTAFHIVTSGHSTNKLQTSGQTILKGAPKPACICFRVAAVHCISGQIEQRCLNKIALCKA